MEANPGRTGLMLITTAHDPTGHAEKLGGTKSRIPPCLCSGWCKSLRYHTLLHQLATQAAQVLLAQSSVSLALSLMVRHCITSH